VKLKYYFGIFVHLIDRVISPFLVKARKETAFVPIIHLEKAKDVLKAAAFLSSAMDFPAGPIVL
jgi:hypothetical protein